LNEEELMGRTVYVETSIISYLTSRVSRDLIAAARQQLTQTWWDSRSNYDLYISEVVSRECAAGDPNAAKKRLDAIEGLALLRTTKEAVELSKTMVSVPVKPFLQPRTQALDRANKFAPTLQNG
jgi:hypothetical protein